MKSYLFKSKRLGFRNWNESDIIPFTLLNKDPEVMKFFPNTLTHLEVKSFIEKNNAHYNTYGYNLYAVDTIEDELFIGFIGFFQVNFNAFFTPCIEIGWRLKKEAWNKGYATEGAQRCLSHGFNVLGFNEIYSFTAINNVKSERVMQKIDMKKLGYFQHPKLEHGHPLKKHVVYKIES